MEQFNNNLVLKGRDSVELKPPFLFKEILIYIFETLDTKAMAAVIRTCKYFQLIGEYVSKSDMEICYIGPPETDVRDIFFSNFKYPFDYVSSKLNLVEPWVKFKPVIQGSETKISSGCSTKALFWVQEKNVKDDTLQLLQRFVSECPQTPILFWKGKEVQYFSNTYNYLMGLRN
jgi:hypothetical protein